MNLTFDEQQVIAIFNIGSRTITMNHLTDMLPDLDPTETELRGLVESAVEKLRSMTDAEFEALELDLNF